MTVGDIRKVIEGLDDESPVCPAWANGAPSGDCEPGVQICGAKKSDDGASVEILVDLFYLDEDEDDEGVCGHCGDECDDIESTYCGSMCRECREKHAEECGVCRDDFEQRGI